MQVPHGPRIIADVPTTTDLLGAHSRVAEGLYQLVSQSPGGKTIALEGPWGSGKSTVVGLLERMCASSDIHVHTHDAWAHEGDPLRRAFLESLISGLLSRGWLAPRAVWVAKLKGLSLRIRDVKRTSTPSLTPFGKLLSLALILVPFGIALFNQWLKDGGGWLLSAGVFVGGLPIWLAVCFALARLRAGGAIDDILAVVLNRTTTEENTSTIESIDPTSIEFQELFSAVLNNAISDPRVDTRRKLVIVIDNLDRISSEEASDVWALLRSFLDMPQHRSRAWIDSVWVIIPLVSVSRSSLAQESLDSAYAERRPASVKINNASSSYLEKVFQASFVLPPPTLKNWRRCLLELLMESGLPSDVGQRQRIVDLYVAYVVHGEAPTPRELLVFVNQMVVLYLQWQTRFDLLTLAAYTLDSASVDVPTALRDDVIPSSTALTFGGLSLREEYACLYFNTGDAAEALEILQYPIAVKIFADGDSRLLVDELCRAESLGLVLSRFLDAELPGQLSRQLAQGYKSLLAILEARDEPQRLSDQAAEDLADLQLKAVRAVSKRIAETKSLALETNGSPQIFREYLPLAADDVVRHTLLPAMEVVIPEIGKDEGDPVKRSSEDLAARWSEGFLAILSDARVRAAVYAKEVVPFIPFGAPRFGTLIASLSEQGRVDLVECLAPIGGLHSVLLHATAALGDGSFTMDDMCGIDWALKRSKDEAFEEQYAASEAWLSTGAPISQQGSVAYLSFLLDARPATGPVVIGRLAAAGVFSHHFQLQLDKNSSDGAGVFLLAHILGAADSAPTGTLGQSAQGWANMSALLADPSSNGDVTEALKVRLIDQDCVTACVKKVIESSGLRKLFQAIFADRSSLDSYFDVLSPSTFRGSVDELCRALNDYDSIRERALDRRLGNADFLGEIVSSCTSKADLWLLYKALRRATGADAVITRQSIDVLNGFGEEDWLSVLNVPNSWALSLAGDLVRSKNAGMFGFPLKSALVKAVGSFVGESAINMDKLDLVAARSLLTEEFTEGFDDDVFELAASAQSLTKKFWEVSGFSISAALVRRGPAIRAGRRIFLPLIGKADLEGLAWLSTQLSEASRLMPLFGDRASLKEFPEALSAAILAAGDDGLRDALVNLEESFNASRRRRKAKATVKDSGVQDV